MAKVVVYYLLVGVTWWCLCLFSLLLLSCGCGTKVSFTKSRDEYEEEFERSKGSQRR